MGNRGRKWLLWVVNCSFVCVHRSCRLRVFKVMWIQSFCSKSCRMLQTWHKRRWRLQPGPSSVSHSMRPYNSTQPITSMLVALVARSSETTISILPPALLIQPLPCTIDSVHCRNHELQPQRRQHRQTLATLDKIIWYKSPLPYSPGFMRPLCAANLQAWPACVLPEIAVAVVFVCNMHVCLCACRCLNTRLCMGHPLCLLLDDYLPASLPMPVTVQCFVQSQAS